MGINMWQLINILGCLLTLVAIGYSDEVNTGHTFLVSKTEDPYTMMMSDATDEPSPEVKLTEMDIQSDIHMRYAHTAVVTHMRNPAAYAQEASFRILLPETAFISGFTMTLDGKEYKAYVKNKEEAREMFSEAVSQGVAAAHIATKARDSNHFRVSVNLEPRANAIFNLTYEELLTRRNAVYNHAINLHPGALVPKLKVTVNIRESQKITTLRVPEVRSGNEIDATESDAQNAKAVIERNNLDARKATITFNPDINEQLRLRDVYAEKSKDSQQDKQNGVLGQFVVQYDVDRTNDDEFLMADGYFVHFFAPSSLPPLNKYVVFVFDTSGSMSWGDKIVKLKEAMDIILSELNPGDYFSIVEFNTGAKVHNLEEASDSSKAREYHDYYGRGRNNNRPKELIAPVAATPENIAKAKIIVSRLYASGGTDIKAALDLALDLIQKTWPQLSPAVSSGASENHIESSEIKYMEPIIMFLTDGQAAGGDSIIQHITGRNSDEERKASIFSLAFGSDADIKFLRQLSFRNDGFMKYVYVASDTALQLRDFYRQISSPVLSGVNFIYPPDQIAAGSLTKNTYRTYYSGSEVIVAGRLADNNTDLNPRVRAYCNGDSKRVRTLYEKSSVFQNPGLYLPLERLWAYLTIKQVLEKEEAAASDIKDEKLEKKALDLALKYSFVTRLTSLVVVKPNATTAVNAESVDEEKKTASSGPGTMRNFFHMMRPASMPHRPSSYLPPPSGSRIPNHAMSHHAFGDAGNRHTFAFMSEPSDNEINIQTTKSTSVLEQFHLEKYSWLVNILMNNTDKIRIDANGVVTELKLSRNVSPPKKSGSDGRCFNPVRKFGISRRGNGSCVYLSRCESTKDLNETTYSQHFCTVNNEYAGVCCQQIDVIESSDESN